MHRFDLTVVCRQPLQRSEAERLTYQIVQKQMSGDCSPARSKAWALPRGFGTGTLEMDLQKIELVRIAEVTRDDTHDDAAQGLGR